ncbi:MAG: hypothetical protein M1385_01065 [Candidatus Marsarchaeota archaeon]|nr:hypothetical protein [Candidatus Marsarchaeota archaeon]
MNSKKSLTAKFAVISSKYGKILISMMILFGYISGIGMSQIIIGGTGTQSGVGGALNAICTVYSDVETVIFILGLTLMILGAALYAGSHVMPSQSKGSLQGYGMGMILGGVVGVIIALLAPYILQLITGQTAAQITAQCGNIGGLLSGF